MAQSHKARHLMSVMLYLKVLSEFSPELGAGLSSRRLAVASCGNAGLAAATIAAAGVLREQRATVEAPLVGGALWTPL